MNSFRRSEFEEITSRLIQCGWVHSVAFGCQGYIEVLWTPRGAEGALTICRFFEYFEVRRPVDLVRFEAACRGDTGNQLPSVGPKVRKYWLDWGEEVGTAN